MTNIGYGWQIDETKLPQGWVIDDVTGPVEQGGPVTTTLSMSTYTQCEVVIRTLAQTSPDFEYWRDAYVSFWQQVMKPPIEYHNEEDASGLKKQCCAAYNASRLYNGVGVTCRVWIGLSGHPKIVVGAADLSTIEPIDALQIAIGRRMDAEGTAGLLVYSP